MNVHSLWRYRSVIAVASTGLVLGAAGPIVAIAYRTQHGVPPAPRAFSLRPEMVVLVEGRFMMGSPKDEPGRFDEESEPHEVEIRVPFAIARTEVTQAQWTAAMGKNPSRFAGEDYPVERVSWFDALVYINSLSRAEGLEECYLLQECSGDPSGGCPSDNDCRGQHRCEIVRYAGEGCRGYRLPSEEEWEYAARAGTWSALYSGPITILGNNNSPEVGAVGWYGGNSGVKQGDGCDCSDWPQKERTSEQCATQPVALKPASPWQLFDIIGNVFEWTAPGEDGEPKAWFDLSGAAVRGCAWDSHAQSCRVAYRNVHTPAYRYGYIGLRPARSFPRPSTR